MMSQLNGFLSKHVKIFPIFCMFSLFSYCILFDFLREVANLPKRFRTGSNYLMLQIKELGLNYIKFCNDISIKEGYKTSAITKMNIGIC